MTSEPSFTKTINQMGYTSSHLNPYIINLIDFMKGSQDTCLDIGAAFGAITHQLLKHKIHVTANDLEAQHLHILCDQTPLNLQKYLTLKPGHFPYEIDFIPHTFKAILVSHVLHFLSGHTVEKGLIKIHQWLKPQGRLYILAGSPYMEILTSFIPVFEHRKQEGLPWPGEVNDLRQWSTHPCVEDMPSFINFMDEDILTAALIKAGFDIVESSMFDREDFPDAMKHSSRQTVGIIAQKNTSS